MTKRMRIKKAKYIKPLCHWVQIGDEDICGGPNLFIGGSVGDDAEQLVKEDCFDDDTWVNSTEAISKPCNVWDEEW